MRCCPFESLLYGLDRLGHGMRFLEALGPAEFLVWWCRETVHSQRDEMRQQRRRSSCRRTGQIVTSICEMREELLRFSCMEGQGHVYIYHQDSSQGQGGFSKVEEEAGAGLFGAPPFSSGTASACIISSNPWTPCRLIICARAGRMCDPELSRQDDQGHGVSAPCTAQLAYMGSRSLRGVLGSIRPQACPVLGGHDTSNPAGKCRGQSRGRAGGRAGGIRIQREGSVLGNRRR